MKLDSTGFSAFQGDAMDCSVRAHAIAAGIPYAAASALFREAGRVPGRRTPGTLTHELYLRLGHEPAWTYWVRRRRYMTLTQFLKYYPAGRYVLHRGGRGGGHAFAVVDGVVHDWSVGTGPRTRICYAWRLA